MASVCAIYLFTVGLYNKKTHKNKKLEPAYQLLSLWPDPFAMIFMEENTVPNHFCSSVSDK